jgi:NAD(P)-dependent dehydrogenase (short-subunit alcohol dehydrogenase family)
MKFENQTVMVTGAAGNLGQAVAGAFARRGARLVLLDRQVDALKVAFGDDEQDHLFLAADLLDAPQVSAALAVALAHFGHINVLCNLAGGFRMGEAVHETSDATWYFLTDLNVRTLLNMTRAMVPHMLARGGGKIVNVAAYAAQKGAAQMGAYCAAKSSVIRLTEAMAAELRGKNINVNCVLPTTLDTPENRAAMPQADPKLWVAPNDLASVIVFLASDAAKAVHGAALPVTGLS